jgi:hypothetical protein
MPRTGQIIPEWLHPYEGVYINDNTRYEDVAFHATGPVFLNVFASGKGVDNKLKYFDSVVDWVNEYGLPNFRKYGQPAYMPYVSLSTGLACSQSMRVMPLDAPYANITVLCHYQVKDGKLRVKYTGAVVDNLVSLDDLDAYVERMGSNTPDEQGYKVLPIMSFWSRGRGLYGNNYRVRISRDKGGDKDNQYVNYAVELMSTETGSLTTLETYTVSFYIDAKDPNSDMTLFVNDIIDDEEGKGSKRFNGQVYYDNLETIFAAYEEAYKSANKAELNIKTVDALPPTEYPDSEVIFVCNDEVKVFNDDLKVFEAYLSNGKLVATDVKPSITGLFEVPEENAYLVNTVSKHVYSFNIETRKVTRELNAAGNAMTLHTLSSHEDPTGLIAGDLYFATNNSKYYLATASNAMSEISTAVVTYDTDNASDDATNMLVDKVLAEVGTVYNVGEEYFVQATAADTAFANITADVQVVEELPSTEIVDTTVAYYLTQNYTRDGILYPAGTYWVYVNGAWAEYDPDEEIDAMVYTMETWDVFGYNKFTQTWDEYFDYDGGTESIAIMSIEGIAMDGGTDGSFSVNGTVLPTLDEEGNPIVVTDATRDKAMEEAYLMAFQGGYDKTIASKRRAPVDLMLDANYPVSVKKAMVALALNRYDAACHLDTNLINNVDDLETFFTQSLSGLNERIVSFDAHCFKTVDPITGKIIPVTITLWLASKIPQHFNVYGNHVPLAGEEYGLISGYQRNSIRPIIDADDEEVKELLYDKLHMNYVECIAENTYIRGTQETSQNFWSDLSEENNMLVLLEIKRKIERLAASHRFHWAEPEDLALFQEQCNQIFSSYRGTKCRTLDIEVSSNAWETTRYITHIYLAVVFRTFQKRAIIEIDVNPRA